MFRGSLIQIALICPPWSFIIYARASAYTFHTTYYELNIASFCHLSSNQCSSSQIIHACHMKDTRQNIQLSRDARNHNSSERFPCRVCSKNILPQYQSLSQSVQDIKAQEANMTGQNDHQPSSNLDLFSFSHTSYQSRSWSFVSHGLYVLVMGVPLSVTA